jgi:AcrR family transcriptional regulator
LNALFSQIKIQVNPALYLKDPHSSVLGERIIQSSVKLIDELGFEHFTFKKLAIEINSTEASIYRYFESKHKLMFYLINWYWSYLEYKTIFRLNNITNTEIKLRTIIKLLVEEPPIKHIESDFITENEAYKLMMWEGSKAYLTRSVSKDNKDRLFKPYKDLCERFSLIIKQYNPKYKFPHSLASTILEMAHSQKFFKQNLPALTDFPKETDDKKIILFLESLLFNAMNI